MRSVPVSLTCIEGQLRRHAAWAEPQLPPLPAADGDGAPSLLAAAPPLRNAVLTSQTLDAVTKGCRRGGAGPSRDGAAFEAPHAAMHAAVFAPRHSTASSGAGRPNGCVMPGIRAHPARLRSSQTGDNIMGCQQCRATGLAGCRSPLAVMSRLCSSGSAAAGLPQCARLAAMCAEAGATFTLLCGGGIAVTEGQAGVPADLKMYLHASMSGTRMLKAGSHGPACAGSAAARQALHAGWGGSPRVAAPHCFGRHKEVVRGGFGHAKLGTRCTDGPRPLCSPLDTLPPGRTLTGPSFSACAALPLQP